MIPTISKLGLPVILLFIIAELSISLRRRDQAYNRTDTLANVAISVGNALLGGTAWASLAFAAYGWAYGLAPVKIPMDRTWTWALLVIAADFAWYVEHYVGHKVRLLWAVHSVHHSSEKFNYSVALRLPWLGGLTRIPFLMLLAFAGFPPLAVFTGFSLVLLYQIWVHTEYIGKLGVLEFFLNTPSHHRVHHGVDRPYLDKNFGGIFIIWDRLFGTFQREQTRPRYGILHPIASSNPLVINFRDLAATLRAMLRAKTVKRGLAVGLCSPAASA